MSCYVKTFVWIDALGLSLYVGGARWVDPWHAVDCLRQVYLYWIWDQAKTRTNIPEPGKNA